MTKSDKIDLKIDNGINVEKEVIEKDIMERLPYILKLWVKGYTYKEIANKLGMSVNQVKYELRKQDKSEY